MNYGYKKVVDLSFEKTDVKIRETLKAEGFGVITEIDVKKTFNDMFGRLSKKKGVEVKGILLEKMVPKGVELIVGIQNDPQFGPTIMVGLGGIMTEIMDDVSFRMLPISTLDAKSMINELKGSKLLKRFRGSAPIDLNM